MTSKKKNTMTDVVTTSAGAVVPHDYSEFAGQGWGETHEDDFSKPFVQLLQATSNVIQEESVPGAKPGQFYHVRTQKLYEAVSFVPCFRTEFVGEVNSGGMTVNRFERHAPEVRERLRLNAGEWYGLTSEEGNKMMLTKVVYGLIVDENLAVEGPGIFTFRGSALTELRKYNDLLPSPKQVPLFAHTIAMTSFRKEFDDGNKAWVPRLLPLSGDSVVESMLPTDHPTFEAAHAICKQLHTGEVEIDYSGDVPY